MKRTIMPILLAGTLLIGGYFLFVYYEEQHHGDRDAAAPSSPAQEDTAQIAASREQGRRMREEADPHAFLALDVESHRNLLRETVIQGQVRNLATYTSYQNISLKMRFLDAEGAALDSAGHMLLPAVAAGDTLPFELKLRTPRGAASLVAEIDLAMPVIMTE